MEKEFIEKIFEKHFYSSNDFSIRTPFIYNENIYYIELNNTDCVIYKVEINEYSIIKNVYEKISVTKKIKDIYFDKVSKDIMDSKEFFIELDILLRELKINKILEQI